MIKNYKSILPKVENPGPNEGTDKRGKQIEQLAKGVLKQIEDFYVNGEIKMEGRNVSDSLVFLNNLAVKRLDSLLGQPPEKQKKIVEALKYEINAMVLELIRTMIRFNGTRTSPVAKAVKRLNKSQ